MLTIWMVHTQHLCQFAASSSFSFFRQSKLCLWPQGLSALYRSCYFIHLVNSGKNSMTQFLLLRKLNYAFNIVIAKLTLLIGLLPFCIIWGRYLTYLITDLHSSLTTIAYFDNLVLEKKSYARFIKMSLGEVNLTAE